MSIPIPDFWSLCVASRLLTPEQVQQLGQQFAGVKGSSTQSNARTLAEWLIAQRHLTRYQSSVLLAGRPGPFLYGEYFLRERIEEGRWNGCFCATHLPTGHPVMIQFLSGMAIQDPNVWQAIQARAKANAAIVHPLIHRLFEAVDLGAFRFFVWDDLQGRCLSEVLAKVGRQLPAEACGYAWQVCAGAGHLHQMGVAHGDVRPENLWLENSGVVRLLREGAGPPGQLQFAQPDPTGQTLARADYASPEFCQPDKLPDGLSDVYALGCTLYQMLTGRVPFPGGDAGQKLSRHRGENPPPVEPFGVPPALGQVVAQMMAKNPAARIPNGPTAVASLAAFVERSRLQAAPTPPAATYAAMEMWLRHRQVAQAPQANGGFGGNFGPAPAPAFEFPASAPAAQGAFGNIPQGVAVAPIPVGTAAGMVAGSSRPVASGLSIAATSKPARRKSQVSTEGEEFLDNPKNVMLLVGGAFLLVALVIVLFNVTRSRRPSSEGEENGTRNIASPDGAIAKTDPGTPPVKPPPKKPGPTENPPPALPVGPATPKEPKDPAKTSSPAEAAGPITIVKQGENDWKMYPWASPTSNVPIALDFLPSGGLAYISLRPGALSSQEEAVHVLSVLGPRFGGTIAAFEKACGFKFSDLDQLLIGLAADDNGAPHYAVVVRLAKAMETPDLVARWGGPSGNPVTGPDGNAVTVYSGAGWAYFIPTQGGGKMFVMASDAKDAAQLIEQNGPPNISKEMRRVLATTDSDRQVVLLVDPRHLFSDERRAVAGDFQKLIGPLQRFLGDDATAVATSFHLANNFYMELRVAGSLDRTASDLATSFHVKVAVLPRQLADYAASLTPHPYWETVRFKFPRMTEMLEENTRMGPEGNTVIVNCVLPRIAASNLIAASDLALASTPGAAAVGGTPVAGGEKKPTSIEEILQLKANFSTPNMSLEACMAQVAEDAQPRASGVDFRIRILGKDLELDGITRNQAIRDFKAEGQPIADILTALVRKANPVTTVKDPSEKDQKLLWVVGPDPDDAKKRMVLITTRAAAEKKAYKLPAVFVLKGK